jgi:hypothetical protein
MKDAPDGSVWVQNVDVVVNEPTPPLPANEAPAGNVGRYTGTNTTGYQVVAQWKVAAGKVGELKEITILSNSYSKTDLKVQIGAVIFATNWIVQAAMPLIFEDLKLAAGTDVKVGAKSTDGTSITVDAVIVGKEIG